MKALILAAGLGTRLLPLTASTPKALVRIHGVTLLEIAIGKLASAGFNDILVNVHHHPAQVIDFIRQLKFPGVNLSVSDETGELLDTGGAILKARWFLEGGDPFLVHNVDVVSDINLQALLKQHVRMGNLATLAVSDRTSGRYLLFDESGNLRGWKDATTNSFKWSGEPILNYKSLAFSGIHVIYPAIFPLITETGRFSVIDMYLRLAKDHSIQAWDHTGSSWFDAGKPEQLSLVSEFLNDHPSYLLKL